MKKSFLILCTVITTFSLVAFSYVYRSNSETGKETTTDINTQTSVELFYDVGSRYGTTVTKEVLDKARSLLDIVPENPDRTTVSYYSVSITILDDNRQIVYSEAGETPLLNPAQVKLIQSVDYSTNILFRADYQEKNKETGELEDSYTTPHITIVPEKQAVCTIDKEELITYVKENTREFAAIVKEEELQPGKVTFSINREGKVTDATLTSTSGYSAFDQKMVEVVSGMPGTWEPATNAKGENVVQKFVFSFGIIGC